MTEWISADILPENNQWVTLYCKFDPYDGSFDYNTHYEITLFTRGARIREYRDDMPGYTLYRYDYNAPNWNLKDDRFSPLYWMPIPELPQGAT